MKIHGITPRVINVDAPSQATLSRIGSQVNHCAGAILLMLVLSLALTACESSDSDPISTGCVIGTSALDKCTI
jgi:hypothetical protein